jgi:hypothetical protein
MKAKQFLKVQLAYVLVYPMFFIIYSLLFERLNITTGNTLLDVGVLMALTGVSGYLTSFYAIFRRVRKR